VRREDVPELHFITHINNVSSIWTNGLLSHNNAARLSHLSVASQDVQSRRALKVIPGGRRLHDYVNLYICGRNPMMYVLSSNHQNLCVLRINTTVFDIPETIITDRNAAVEFVRFSPSPAGLSMIDKDLVYAEYWAHDDPARHADHKAIKCAEVLVPDRLPPGYIDGVYVSCRPALIAFQATRIPIPVTINAHLFFR
jgi:hypothetical protein